MRTKGKKGITLKIRELNDFYCDGERKMHLGEQEGMAALLISLILSHFPLVTGRDLSEVGNRDDC